MVGIMVESSIEDYLEDKIKVHERTLSRVGYNHESYKKDHVGPVILSYEFGSINIRGLLFEFIQKKDYFSKWMTVDGR
jgi:uncharacterized protein (DUF1015 family)